MKRLIAYFSVLVLFLACSKEAETPAPQPKPKFTITVAAGEGGAVSSTGGSYEQGSTVSVTATASSGYRFTGWSNGETSATLNITVTGNLSVTALFEKIAYSVDISGAVSKGAFLTGSTLTFYELNNSLSQTGKSYNTDITDNFGTYSLSVEVLTEDYARVVGEGFYWNEVTNTNTEEKLSLNAISEVKEGINVNVLTHLEYQRVIELVKNQGKSFADAKKQALTETLSSLGIETTTDYGTSEQFNFKEGDEKSKILVVASAIIQAERSSAEVTELITTVANDLKDNGNIDDTEVKTDIAVQLAKINLSEVASNIYERYKEENPELTQDNFTSDYLEIAKSEYQEFLPDADGDGVQDDLDLCPDTPEGEEADANGCGKTQKQYQLTTTVEGSGSISEEVIEQPTASYDYGTTVRLTANPITGWEFKEWKGGITSTENPVDITVVEEVAVTAVFVKKQFTITTSIEGEGTVAVSPEAEAYDFQSTVELTATPSEGWVFSEWKGSTNSTDNPLSISMNDNKEITAVFKRKQYELTVTVQGEGAVAEEIVTEPSQYDNGTAVKLTATAAEGWEFTGWSGDLEGVENPTRITIDEAKSVTATFEKADSDGDGVVDLDDLCPDTPEGEKVNANGCHDIIYVAENGVTIKARETAIVGDTQELDGVEYTVVDEAMLREMVANDEDVTKVVTTLIGNMNGLFDGNQTFNQDISEWDLSNVTSVQKMFHKATLFNQDISNWDVSKVTDFTLMFWNTNNFNSNIGNWDVSSGINFSQMFGGAQQFNQDIGSWNVSNATNLGGMFSNATSFNQDLSSWDVSNVTIMADMFHASAFNHPIGNWDVSNVTNMSKMFWSAGAFNQDLSNWDVSNVTTMRGMFDKASSFDQNINDWDVSNVIDMWAMFAYSAMNNPLNNWDVSSVVNMDCMFCYNNSFNQDLSSWCVSNISNPAQSFNLSSSLTDENLPIWGQCGEIYLDDNGVTIKARENAVVGESYKLTNEGDSYKVVDETMLREMVANDEDVTKVVTTKVTNMNLLFNEKTTFNQDIKSWDVSKVTNMRSMFRAASLFNQDISIWDTSQVQTMHEMFGYAESFNQELNDWNVENVTDFERMFSGAKTFNQSISSWDISKATSLNYMFADAEDFNQDLNQWDVSNIKSMLWTFSGATSFNGNISNWDTSVVETMSHMFGAADSFNQDISDWDTSAVVTMERMFSDADVFNVDISNWEVFSVINMDHMFYEANAFNQDLSSWCVSEITEKPDGFNQASGLSDENLPIWGQCGEIELAANGVTIVANDNAVVGESYKLTNEGDSYKVVDEVMLREMVSAEEDVTNVVTSGIVDMSRLFEKVNTFNQDIGSWDTSDVIDMSLMFSEATLFNQNLNFWDVSKVINMEVMFHRASSFNSDIGNWDVSSVTLMGGMFYNTPFNQDISNWDVSNVTDMGGMFSGASQFNQQIGNWDVSNVTNMGTMFQKTSFNQDISNWDTSKVVNMKQMFDYSEFNQDINSWNVSNVNTFNKMFIRSSFNQPLDLWDVSSATNMELMFWATPFNQNISDWCVSQFGEMPDGFVSPDSLMNTNENLPIWGQCGEIELAANGVTIVANENAVVGESYKLTNDGDTYKVVDETMLREMVAADEDVSKVVTTQVTNMSFLFANNDSFNQNIGSWDVSNVTNMNSTFWFATIFNQDLNYWDVSNVTDMHSLFDKSSFNGNVSTWNTGNVKDMFAVFAYTPFNRDISKWDTSSVTNMHSMFQSNQMFNGDISQWDVSNVENFRDMFTTAISFNQPLNSWDVGSARDMIRMFSNTDMFNQDLSNWDVSSVENMSGMFKDAVAFNKPLDNWNVSNVTGEGDTGLQAMFARARSFSQDLSNWCVTNITTIPPNFRDDSELTDEQLPIWGTCPSDHNSGGSGGSDAGSTGN